MTFTATVAGAAGTPTGLVTFYEKPQGDSGLSAQAKLSVLGSNEVALTNGTAVFETSFLQVGIHSIVAV